MEGMGAPWLSVVWVASLGLLSGESKAMGLSHSDLPLTDTVLTTDNFLYIHYISNIK